VLSTLVSLIGAVLTSLQVERGVLFSFGLAFIAGTVGVFAMITRAIMLARETTFSFRVLKEEKNFITGRVHERIATLVASAPAK
jgi:hypothetical protein